MYFTSGKAGFCLPGLHYGYSIPPTLERPTEKVRKSCYKPLKMRNISPLKSIYTKYQVLGTSGKYRTDSLLRVRIFFKMSLFVTNSTEVYHILENPGFFAKIDFFVSNPFSKISSKENEEAA